MPLAAQPTERRRTRVRRLLLPLVLAAAGCDGLESAPRVLRLVRFDQAGAEGVFLNETLVLHFDAPLDRSSVTSASALVIGPGGEPAQGEFDVQRSQLHFRPTLPRARDLSDGGFRPDTEYRVELRGFPWPDAVRGRDGAPLASGYAATFRTARAYPEGETPLFQDETLDRALPLRLAQSEIPPGGPLRLECDEPLDPTTLRSEDFELQQVTADGLDRAPVRAVLTQNGPGGAVIELWPVQTYDANEACDLDPGGYHLWLEVSTSALQDLGGHVVPPAWLRPIPVRVVDTAGPRRSALVEFVAPYRATPAAVPGADGLARWGGDVTVPFPRSAGEGRDGAVRLAGEYAGNDLHATRLSVAEGVEVLLTGTGVVVLRAQGSLAIDGNLIRRLVPEELARRPDESNSAWLLRTKADWPLPDYRAEEETFQDVESLHAWLEHLAALREQGADVPPFTVLVAGGDLTISGRLSVDGPLLLAQGGRLRVTGEVQARSIRRVGRGGGAGLDATRASTGLSFLPPLGNPLRDTYRFALTLSPIRPAGGVRRWLTARVEGHQGNGSYRVSFIGERERAGLAEQVTEPVEDLALLEDCDAVRLVIELEVGPGEVWDPPRVDFVNLTWE